MKWKESNKQGLLFNYNSFKWYKNNNKSGDPFYDPSYLYPLNTRGFIYPKQDLSGVDNHRTKTIKSNSTLYFDQGSSFPRFKLGLTDNKRCIKTTKANYIVVSGEVNVTSTNESYVVLEDSEGIYFIRTDQWDTFFGGQLSVFTNNLNGLHDFKSDVKVIYNGKLQSFDKDSLYIVKYINGEYTVPFITDNDLDKICCSMCPEPTYEEFLSIIDMLNSDDASVVQLGVKMLTGYNIDKYKLSFRLILCTRKNWFEWSKNLVACKQLVDTLGIDRYSIYDNFSSGCNRVEHSGETYDVEDIAIAKRLAYKFIKEDLQKYLNNYYISRDYTWMPDERTIELK